MLLLLTKELFSTNMEFVKPDELLPQQRVFVYFMADWWLLNFWTVGQPDQEVDFTSLVPFHRLRVVFPRIEDHLVLKASVPQLFKQSWECFKFYTRTSESFKT